MTALIAKLEFIRDHECRGEAEYMAMDAAIDQLHRISRKGTWQYYTNDEGKARWKCSECGKVCRRDPREKRYCSACGCEMGMEA